MYVTIRQFDCFHGKAELEKRRIIEEMPVLYRVGFPIILALIGSFSGAVTAGLGFGFVVAVATGLVLVAAFYLLYLNCVLYPYACKGKERRKN